MKELDLISNESIRKECNDFLNQDERIDSVIVGDIEGNLLYAVAREELDVPFNPELVVSNMASALGISSNFLQKEFKDQTRSFTLFRLKHASIAVLYNKTIVFSDVMTRPRTTFEEKVKIEVHVEKLIELAEKIDAILSSIGSIPFLEKLKQALPRAKMLGIFTETGTPIYVLKTGLDHLDDAYVAAVSAALTLSSQHVSENERQAMAVIGEKTMALIRKIRSPSHLLVPKQEEIADDASQSRILITILPRDDEGVEHYFSLIESFLRTVGSDS